MEAHRHPLSNRCACSPILLLCECCCQDMSSPRPTRDCAVLSCMGLTSVTPRPHSNRRILAVRNTHGAQPPWRATRLLCGDGGRGAPSLLYEWDPYKALIIIIIIITEHSQTFHSALTEQSQNIHRSLAEHSKSIHRPFTAH